MMCLYDIGMYTSSYRIIDDLSTLKKFISMKNVLFLLAGFLGCVSVQAQTINGRIVDKDDSAVVYANVVVLNAKDSSFVSGAITNENGSFVVVADWQNRLLRVSCVGYETKYFPCTQNEMGSLQLLASTLEMNEVEVKATRPIVKIEPQGMKVTVQGSVLEKAGDVRHLLNRIPNVSVVNDEIEVFGRGTPVIYINGKNVQDKSTLNSLRADHIKQIEVITSPGARYGSEVTSVINIITKKQQGEGWSMEVSSEGKVREGIHFGGLGDVILNYRKGNFDLRANIFTEYIRSQNDKVMTQETFLNDVWKQNNSLSQENYSLDLYSTIEGSYQLNENHSLGAKVILDTYPQIGGEGEMSSVIFKNDKLYETSHNHYSGPGHERSYSTNFYYMGKIGKIDLSWNVDWYRNKFKTDMYNTEDYALKDGVSKEQMVSTVRKTINNLFASKIILSALLWKGSLSVGAEYSGTNRHNIYNVLPLGIVDEDDSRLSEYMSSGFMDYSRQFGRLMVKAGLRYEHVDFRYYEHGMRIDNQSKNYDHFLPSIALMLPVGKLQMQLAYMSSIQRPSYWELRSGVQYDNRYTYESGNPFLNPSITNSITYSLTYKWLMFYTAFNKVSKPILQLFATYKDDPTISVMQPINYRNYKTWSSSVTLQPVFGIWHPSLSLFLQKQWFDMQTQDNRDLNLPIGQVRFDNTLDTKFGTVSMILRATTKGANQNMYMGKGVFVANISAGKTFFKDRLSVVIQADDLFGTGDQYMKMYAGRIRVNDMLHYNYSKFSVSLTYKFNAAQRKYRGNSAGKEQRERM